MPSPHRVPACTTAARRPGRAAGVVLAAGASFALLAGCASATSGTTDAGAAAPAAVTSSAAPSVTGLAMRVATAVAAATSVHVAADLSGVPALPVPVGAVAGDLALTSGKPTAAAVTAGSYALRYVDGSAWVTLPGSPAATPWTLVSSTSSNPIVAMAATRLGDLQTKLASLDPSALLGAASDLREVGPAEVGGASTTEYSLTVDPAALARAFGVTAPADASTPVPVQVWLDASDRPVQITASPTVHGTVTPLTVTLSSWNAPVSITAPAADQVGG